MGLKEMLKQNNTIRKIGKTLKIYKEFLNDASGFSGSYLEAAEEKGDYRYSILLIVHSIEKGMCMPSLRPFGVKKVKALVGMLKAYNGSHEDFEYQMGVAVLYSWKEVYKEHGWQDQPGFEMVCAFLEQTDQPSLIVGSRNYSANIFKEKEQKDFEKVLLSRHSVRDFEAKELKKEDVEFAVTCFLEAPTACNRQMCRILQIKDQKLKDLLNDTIIGISGFNKDTANFFIVIYDLAAFAYSGERQQGLLNAGLCTMNLINGFHARGIGSCCLQWSNKHSDDLKIRSELKLRDSERIAVVVAAGYYLPDTTIPCSVRRLKKDIYSEI